MFETRDIRSAVRYIAEVTGRIKEPELKQVLEKVRDLQQPDSFDYTRFEDGHEKDCIVWVDYNPITRTFAIEID